ncbi:MAG: VWA domain-containing protein [Parachlamydiaceae bacterium]|nr:VWA domain-containing protein [Parachlamydiaceae bacterium]
MSDFHFLRPQLLWAIIPLIGLSFFWVYSQKSSQVWKNICSSDLLPHLLIGKERSKILPLSMILIALILFVFGIAGPTWELIPQPLIQSQSGLVIALDLSSSMDGEDIKPSRLDRAIYKIKDFLKLHREGQTALIVFTSEPFVVTPLTEDVATIQALLPTLETSLMPVSGHNLSKVINKASELFSESGISDQSLLVVTSELTKNDMEKSLNLAKEKGIKISILGVGSEEGTPIPKKNGGFLTDKNGGLRISKLEQKNLYHLASTTGGTFVKMTLDDQDIQQLEQSFFSSSHVKEQSDLFANQWHDQGYWFVLFALPFSLLLFRKGVLVVLLCFCIPSSIQAFSWNDLWKTPDQQGSEYFQNEDFEKAQEHFQHLDWKGASYYKSGDYEKASEVFKENSSLEGLFNLGTSKAKLGDYQGALEAYNKVLEQDPNYEDAQYNKKIIEDFLKENQQQDKDSSQENQDSDSKQDKNEKNKDQKSKDPKNKDQNEKQDSNNSSEDSQEQENNSESDSSNDSQENDSHHQQKESDDEENQKNDSDQMKEKEKTQEDLEEQYRDQIEEEINKNEHQEESKVEKVEESQDQKNENQRQIDERWLQKVKDDPGGLLRRKFLQEYQQRRS